MHKQFPEVEIGEAVLQESNLKLKKYIGNDKLNKLVSHLQKREDF
jgi:hypothetical protein